jgi:PAS domain S-box-containing protein
VERLAEKEKLLLASLAEGVYGVDAREKCMFVNPAALAMLGFDESELSGNKVHDLFHGCAGSGLATSSEQCPILLTLRDGVKREVEETFMRKDGTLFPVSLAVSAMKHEGRIVGAVVAFQDITERKRAEQAVFEAQQVFRALVENSPDIVARYDRDCRRTYVNPTYLNVAHIPQDELQNSTPEQRSPLPKESAAILQQLLKRVLDCGVAEAVDVVWPKADGMVSWYNIYAFPEFNREGRVVSVMTVSRDITGRKRAEDALRRLNEELEQEVAERQVAQENLQEQALVLENEMEQRYAAQKELEQANERLDQRVRERTAELEANNADLEKMLKSYVGRELRMVELKERIKQLETGKAR